MSVLTRKSFTLSLLVGAALSFAACSGASNAASDVKAAASTKAADVVTAAKDTAAALTPGANIADAPSGVYKSESGHAYITMAYDHQGFSRPILRWGAFDATVNLDSENPENSSLEVVIDAASIDSGVEKFDEHLVSPDFFDVENFPKITFTSSAMEQVIQGRGQVTGELTIKDITKPVTLDVTLNKIGNHFRSGVDMFGISAKTTLRRDDFGVGKYGTVGQEVDIQIEVEFQKAQ